jgi:oligopeptide transport system ATP-binding protein
LIADEPTTALDVATQAEILSLLSQLRRQLDMALLLISHDLAVIASACDRVAVMYAGRTVEWGDKNRVFGHPVHPYSIALLQSARAARDAAGKFVTIEGDGPNLAEPIGGCPFEPRCPLAIERCAGEMPGEIAVAGQTDHAVRCWRAAEQQASCGFS